MFRRVVALLLLPSVLLPQWASARQCHGCTQAAGHERGPHIHLTAWPFTAFVPQAQDHQGCCHHHDGDLDDDLDCGGEKGGLPARHHEDSAGHEGGVVYLPTSLLHGWLTGRTPTCLDDGDSAVSLPVADNLMIQGHSLLHTRTPLPFLTVADPPTCLRTLPLLI